MDDQNESTEITELEEIERKRRVDVAYFAALRILNIRNEMSANDLRHRERTPSKKMLTVMVGMGLLGFWLVSNFEFKSGLHSFGLFILIILLATFVNASIRDHNYRNRRTALFDLVLNQNAIFNGAMGGGDNIDKLNQLWQNKADKSEQPLEISFDSDEFEKWWDKAYVDSFKTVCGKSRGMQVAAKRGLPEYEENRKRWVKYS